MMYVSVYFFLTHYRIFLYVNVHEHYRKQCSNKRFPLPIVLILLLLAPPPLPPQTTTTATTRTTTTTTSYY